MGIRSQGDGKRFPPDQIFTLRMPPMHRTRSRLIRMILIEEMIVPGKERKAVRVVKPSDIGSVVIPWPVVLDDLVCILFHVIVRSL
ncbi:hypothetical protein D9M68_966750 [compost metagenome]